MKHKYSVQNCAFFEGVKANKHFYKLGRLCTNPVQATLPAQKHHHRVGLGRDEAQQEDIATATVVALQHSFPQRAIFMQGHLLGLCSHQVVYNVAKSRTNDN